jgi:hypothetical protein
MDDLQTFMSLSSRVFFKTAEAIPACSGNQFMLEKVASSIDHDKAEAIHYLYKSASVKSKITEGLLLGIGAAAPMSLALGGTAIAAASPIASKAVESATDEGEKQVAEKAKNYMKYLAVPAALLALGGSARAGLLGDSAQDYSKSILGSITGLFGGDSKSNKSEYSPGSFPYKIAAAKTYCNLSSAYDSCTDSADLEKIADARDACGQILFDCIFYL